MSLNMKKITKNNKIDLKLMNISRYLKDENLSSGSIDVKFAVAGIVRIDTLAS